MTRRTSAANWRDALYNTIREVDGGVGAAASFLTDRRDRYIHREDLRKRLSGRDGESLSTEMLELLAEWLIAQRHPRPLSWLQALNGQFGMAAAYLPPPPDGGWPCEAAAIRDKLLQITAKNGALATIGMNATADGQIDGRECDELEAKCMQAIELLWRLRRNARRAAGRSEDFT